MEKRELIINRLREKGFRITKQRLIILDVVLEGDSSSSKEILYKAQKQDDTIGAATVYRMLNTLEELGYISRKEFSNVMHIGSDEQEYMYTIEFDDESMIKLSSGKWNQIIREGLMACGYDTKSDIKRVHLKN